jgi:hypothetical protein
LTVPPHRLLPAPVLIGGKPRFVSLNPFRDRGTLGHVEKLVDGEALRPTVDGHPVEPADNDRIVAGDARVFADDDVDAVDFPPAALGGWQR